LGPEVSVVIPAKNAGPYIRQALEALAMQDYEGEWEVIVADNGSDDDTRHIVESCVDLLARLRVVDASQRRGVAFARNRGAEAAKGQYLAFCDADDVVSPWWLRSLVSQGRSYSICYGQLAFFKRDPPDPAKFSQLGADEELLVYPFGYLPFATGGNLLVQRAVFAQLNGFDEAYGAGEDVDFCWRAQYEGFTLGRARSALIFIRVRESARSQFRQYYGYGKGEVHLYRDHALHGMPRSSVLRAVATYGWLIAIGVVVLARRDPYYRLWVNSAGRRCGRLAGSLRLRRVYL
jgi:glycosyltransferase involved in cell wall biosynthesis